MPNSNLEFTDSISIKIERGVVNTNPFKFPMGAKVKGVFAGEPFIGEIVTRLEAGKPPIIQYAVYSNKEFCSRMIGVYFDQHREWFTEEELELADEG